MGDSLLFLASGRGDRTHDRADMSRLLCQLSYLAANERIYIRCGGFSQYGEYPAPGSQPLASGPRLPPQV